MTAAFVFDPNAVYDVKNPDDAHPIWRIQDRKVYAYLEHDPRRDWSGDIGILVLCLPRRLVDHDGRDLAFIEGKNVRCVDGREFSLVVARG
ncbi:MULTISPECIES: hypothetical protein [unclassified Pseudomonas]|uniref:hypothetical protein n=2 Tax=Pseudomonas TaxID=286 RepID=UPI002AC990BC|nr:MULTISPECIES: hypothetical protein [unclassified Pseudomonas]MEB0042490.1 hypothetical protein [Pseudomonas sp. MH10]MEB0077349.1 hypothetical protein [Pseudomonas sp. MH10out]MEB0092869.1 hypothetical protein [Pseudomonas sp. CCI4.2]MEB0104305.1 hypothetical protein [Pseudomonas sp. CCI3.2]MEB0120527.1 hypothetical protein [Pseudomonas sp. CCI1.2]